MEWFEMSVKMPDDPKFDNLAARLRNPLAFGYVVRLYAHCYALEQDHFAGPGAVTSIEKACHWKGKTGHLVAVLLEPDVGVLEREGADQFTVHGVQRRLAKAHVFRQNAADRKARWEEKRRSEQEKEHGKTPPLERVPERVPNASGNVSGTATERQTNQTNQTDQLLTTTAADAATPGLTLLGGEPPRRKRPSDAALEALEASLSDAYREAKGEELDWAKSAHGELQAIRKALADDAEVLRRWRLFLADAYWPIKNVNRFRAAFQHAKFQRPSGPAAAGEAKRYPSIPEFR